MDERFRDVYIPNSPKRIHLIDREDKVGDAVEYLLRHDILGYDTETYHKFDKHKPAFNPVDGARMRLAQFGTASGHAFVFDLRKVNKNFLHYMFPNRFLCVIQNAKFELKYLMFELGIYDFGPIWDTLIAEQILSRGRVSNSKEEKAVPVGLDKIAERLLGVKLPKDYQASEWYRDNLSSQQIEYAARDSIVVLPIYQKQRDRMRKQSQVRVNELEMDCIAPNAWMENNGMALDTEAWLKVCDQTAKELDEVKKELWRLLGRQGTLFNDMPTFNLNSKQQAQQLFEDSGIELPLHPETGEPTLTNKLLEHLNHFDAVKAYIKFAKLSKRWQSYGPDWVDKVNPYTGRIHPSLKQIGAETGREACFSPNLMQIPKENMYRNCFVPRGQDWLIVDNDYSQCELRILAELCRDPNLLKAFDSDQDLHRFTASLLYAVILDDVTDKQRSTAKNMNFLIVYGGGAHKLAAQAGVTIETAEMLLDLYLKKVYPGMGHWLETQGASVLFDLRTYTMTGRTRQYSGDLRDKKFKSKVQRNSKNYPIQGTNADITKLALSQSYRAIVKGGYVNNIKMILPVHDEIVAEAEYDYAFTARELIQREMLSAEAQYLKRVPCKVDGTITKLWCKDPTPEQLAEGHLLAGGDFTWSY